MPYQEIRVVRLQLQFAQVEQALASMHSVAGERRSAFQGRLKHYQKQQFPSGINTGRGKAATYFVQHAVQLAVALEMNQVGLTPERTVRLCTEHGGQIQGAVLLATSSLMSDDEEGILLVFDPVVLADLRGEEQWDETGATFEAMRADEFRATFNNQLNLRSRRFALINVTAVVDELSHRLGEVTKRDEFEIRREIRASADQDAWRNGNP